MRRKIVIFGCSGLGRQLEFLLDDRENEIVAYLDNNPDIQGGRFHGIRVLAPEYVNRLEYDKIIISLADYDISMREQLYGLGVDRERVETFLPPMGGIKCRDLRYAVLRSCAELIAERKIPGSMAEVGVYKGEFASCMNRCLPDRKLYLFDTFEGFSGHDEDDRDRILPGNLTFKDGDANCVMEKMDAPAQVVVKKGWFPETAEGIEDTFCLVSLDADLYKPIYAGLSYFYSRLAQGGYILIHDFGGYQWPGVKTAVNDFCNEQGISYTPVLDRCLSCIIAK